MNASQQNVPSRMVDLRDDYQNGFMDALFYQQGIEEPTLAQIGHAIAVLIGYRAHHDFSQQEQADKRLEQLAAMNRLRTQLAQSDEHPLCQRTGT
jgi:hypothetical protein